MSDAIVFSGVSRTFGALRAVDGLDLRVGRGETVALLGPNGAGKSTAINLLVGLLEPTAGRVGVFGDAPRRAVAAGRVGVMLQEAGLMPGTTVGVLVGFACRVHRRSRPVRELLADAGIDAIARRRTDRLSGGQAQRVRFAMAIAGDPDLLLLDEPTAAMDVESRRRFWAAIRGYAAGGRTVLFTTHYLDEADENADRVIVIAGGRVVVDGTPTEIKAAVGGRCVRFTLGGDPATGLDRLPGVTAVEVHGGTVALRTTDAEATVRALCATRDRLPDLEVSGAALEDAVLALTR